ncbi:MAG: hypothetical protein H0X66_06365 [Verrucomicrobia bacterium]|nr:hypothetical protein [Verrucomicrobiota bacterium]
MIRFFPLLLATLFLVGCATGRKIDWSTRINNYTYDQAIVELGPPDRSAQLSDGSTIAEWYQRRSGPSIGLGTGIGHGPVGVGVGVPITGPRTQVMRLAFGSDGVLRSVN